MDFTEATQRKEIGAMTDRELLEEICLRMRRTEDTVKLFIEHMSRNPMLGALMGNMGR